MASLMLEDDNDESPWMLFSGCVSDYDNNADDYDDNDDNDYDYGGGGGDD